MMRLQMAGNTGSSARLADTRPRSAGRRGWGASLLMVAATLATAVGSYSLSLKVSGERAQLDRIASANRALAADIRSRSAELRVRMRLPQLQRWNDDVLGLLPITAEQFVENPVRLATFASEQPVAANAPTLQLAIAPQPAAPAGPRLVALRDAPRAAATPEPSFTPSAPTYSTPAARPQPEQPRLIRTAVESPARSEAPGRSETPARPRAEKPAAPRPEQHAPAGLDPLLVAAIDAAARREAAQPASPPANLLKQVDFAAVSGTSSHP